MAVHVFWDNSNIWISLQNYCSEVEGVPPASVRVYLRNLDDYVVRGRTTGDKVIAGSYPPESEDIIQTAEQLGYDTKFLYRITDKDRNREQGVDMHLHFRMSLALNKGKEKEVMAVLTGDSKIDPDSNSSFIEMIELALAKGWDVEVYAVKGCLSEKNYAPLLAKYGSSLQIEYIDSIYEEITYIKEGDFHYPNTPEARVHVAERIVAPRSW